MRYLIDGYNLMYALGLVRRNGGRAGWIRARQTMLDWLADQLGAAADGTTVVLDAQNSLGGRVEETHRGLRVIRHRGRTADDVIEDMLKDERSPETLTVVSNDSRVRAAAGRRGCHVQHCSEYVDFLIGATARPAPESPVDEKEARATPEEMAEWLKAFGG